MLEKNKKVVFELDANGRNISAIVDKGTGESIPLRQVNRTFEVEMTLSDPRRPFGRRGARP